jgi:GNAT superfamily N-acetyltransferase
VALSAIVEQGLSSYLEFAPDWSPPAAAHDPEALSNALVDPEVWCLVGELGSTAAGHVSFVPARRSRRGAGDPRLAHLWQLFLLREAWGTGMAAALLDAALGEARRRGFYAMRLFTPAGQSRARRFYEREGFGAAGRPFDDPGFGMELVEYRREL